MRLALEHRETDRIPIATICDGINEPAYSAFGELLQRERGLTVQAYLDSFVDIRGIGPAYVGPKLPKGQDCWGVQRKAVCHGQGVYEEIDVYPLAHVADVSDLEDHAWPTPDLFDFSVIPAQIAAHQAEGDYGLIGPGGNPFETSWYMRGFEQIFVDMVVQPEIVHGIMRRVTDFHIERARRALAAAPGRIDLAFTADDIAGQNGLLISLPMWEEFIKPYHVELNQAIHEGGAKVMYHSDGAVMEAVPGLLDMGIDILQALQFDARGMDPATLKARHGDRLCFQGGVSVQRTLPFGTVEDVRAEVEHLITVLGRDGGYILGPAHCIQAGTPPENIYALYETAVNFYPLS